jgi:hypothetical protein
LSADIGNVALPAAGGRMALDKAGKAATTGSTFRAIGSSVLRWR